MSQHPVVHDQNGPFPRHILVGFDGSPYAEQAFETALNLAAMTHARLGIVAVATLSEPPGAVETRAAIETATQHYEDVFENLRRRADSLGVVLETRILVGHPAEQIIRLAADTRADLIVVGPRGRSRISQWVFGSVSKRIVNHAPCSVLVVRRT